MTWLRIVILAVTFASCAPALAVQPDEVLKDPALESRARVLSRELRCMVCQNQSIDDSDAPLARDLRLLVRERLSAGDSDSKVLDFLVARYGEFVLLKPRFAWHNALLWTAPLLILVIGFGVMFFASRRRTATASEPALAPGEERRLGEIMRKNQAGAP
jgi:cytochrome c-type biogenesis protein CcmH